MAPPTHYNRTYSFTNFASLYPTTPPPGNALDQEFNAILAAVNATMDSLALIQKSDSTVANASIGPAQLSSQLTTGFTPPSLWATSTSYTASPASCVLNGTSMYICLISHTSGTFATDLANGNWLLIFNLATLTFGTATAITVTPNGGNVATNVQTSLTNLDSNKAATSHTHTSSQISDSTSAGRGMLTAANVAAQQTLLGLGSLAYLNTVAVSAITGNLAFTGRQAPAAISSNTNDYTTTGWATSAVFELSASTRVSITGLTATTDGDLKIIDNVGPNIIDFTVNDTNSAAANRIALPHILSLLPGQTVIFKYDGATAVWRLYGQPPQLAVATTFKNLYAGNVAGPNGFTAPASPNSQYNLTADSLILENDASTMSWRVLNVSVSADLTVSGAGGLDTGTVAAGTGYYFWVIGNPTAGGTISGLWSTSATSPTLPSGYKYGARLGWGVTNGSSQLQRVLQQGRQAQYVISASVTSSFPIIANGVTGTYSDTSPTLASVSTTLFVPPTASRIILLPSALWKAGAISNILVAPNNYGGTNNGPEGSNGRIYPIWVRSSGGSFFNATAIPFLLESSNIWVAMDAAGGALGCAGWEDNI